MKTSGQCQKCQGKEIFHSPYVMDRGDGNEAMCLAIGRGDAITGNDLGVFEVYACTDCGYCEFYVVNPRELKEHRS